MKNNEANAIKIKYKDLAEYMRLAIEEYEYYNNTSVEGYSFDDIISWLDHFGKMETNSFGTRKK